MNSVARLREIVARYIECEPGAVTIRTAIDQAAVGGSIRFHRMFSAIEGHLQRRLDRSTIRTFGDLVANQSKANIGTDDGAAAYQFERETTYYGIGIDIESIESLPVAEDIRAHEFYRTTFTQREISHCLLNGDAISSLAGRYAAKEAIIKADARYANVPLDQIEITTNANGAPIFPGFLISISHAAGVAVAVAIRLSRDA